MESFYIRRRPARWNPHHVRWGWTEEPLPSTPVRYYTYSDDEDDAARRNNVPMAAPPERSSSDDLKVVQVNTRARENARAHHTDKFDQVDDGNLILRRGQVFTIDVGLNRLFNPNLDTIKFIFYIGSNPLPGNGTLVSLTDADNNGGWTTNLQTVTGNEIEVSITTAPNCIIGDWRLSIHTGGKGHALSRYNHGEPIYILFNPWCKRDDVYFPDEEKLSEYILNDSGCIFTGNYWQMAAKPWFFGQFEEGILTASIYCLARAFNFRNGRALADPVRVSRALSKIVNSSDDRGVLVGNWSNRYDGGKSPLYWSGSVAILRQYIKTKAPVKFGQCFVFSGILTTICRALGLPCRSVTNFRSAHDSDASITIDKYWDIAGNQETALPDLDRDEIWNFHCWNDVWMKRSDLPLGYSGWQVVDATPQEASDGVFQCGPTSLVAVLNGKCDLLYDAPFVFAEVNADIISWGREADGEWQIINIDKSSVGKKISTKVPDGLPLPQSLSDCERIREDITNQYKYVDETEKERLAVVSASRSALTSRNVYRDKVMDVSCKMAPLDNVLIGSDCDISVVIKNSGAATRTFTGQISCHSVTYTGVRVKNIKARQFHSTIGSRQEEIITLPLSAGEYLDQVTENAALKICLMARVQETGQVITLTDDFRFRIPDLQLELLTKTPRVNSVLQYRVYLKNPLRSRSLTNCSLDVEGPGLKSEKSFKIGMIQANQDFTGILELTPIKPGLKQIFATFECDQLQDVKGVDEVFVYASG